jgi:hypothetical protein
MGEIIHAFFKDTSRRVHEAAAYSLCDVYDFALPKESDYFVITYIFDPLTAMVTQGANTNVQ